jgi:hypothetical protein
MSLPGAKEINQRWATPAQFYRERDNRTMLEVQNLDQFANQPVEIHVDPREADKLTVQQIALLACNLTARWARRVRVVMPLNVPLNEHLRRDDYNTLDQRIISEMRAADPFGDFRLVSPTEARNRELTESPLRLLVGSWIEPLEVGYRITVDDYIVSAGGWSVFGRRGIGLLSGTASLPAITPATGLAASIGAADLFKRAVGHPREQWMQDFAWCLWTHRLTRQIPTHVEVRRVSDEIDFGRTLLAGVGAIGSALVYLLDMMNLKGQLTLLDRDQVELSNLNRSPLFDVSHVLARDHKTAVAVRYLSRHDLELRLINGTWHEHSARIVSEPYDVWVSFTNEDGAWAEVPFQLPPIVLHGTTTSGWGFSAGRHIPRLEDCTLCRMPRPEAEFRGPCAEGEIESVETSAPVRASLPFLSAASASLVLAELLKLSSPVVVQLPNDASADLRYGLPAVIALKRTANSNCRGCRAVNLAAWENRGGRSRYRQYSMPEPFSVNEAA